MKRKPGAPRKPSENQDKIRSPSQNSMNMAITDGNAELLLSKKNGDYDLSCPKTPTTQNAIKRQKLQGKNITFSRWCHITPDLLKLIMNKLNYQERISLRATCKNWNAIKQSMSDPFHDMPLNSIAIMLMKTSHDRFRSFFNFLIFWIRGQTQKTIKALLDHIPIQELYQWGHDTHRPNESMFTYFMSMAQRLDNMDAEFYWVCKSIVLRNHVYYDIFEYSYRIIEDLSTKGHMLSLLFKNMIDIYFFPIKRQDAVVAIIQIITSPETKQTINGMILALKKIGGQIYPDTIFAELSGPQFAMLNFQMKTIIINLMDIPYTRTRWITTRVFRVKLHCSWDAFQLILPNLLTST